MTATFGRYKHNNPNRKNFWVERFRRGYHGVKFYEPTPSSRRRLARLFRSLMARYDTGRTVIYCLDPLKKIKADETGKGLPT